MGYLDHEYLVGPTKLFGDELVDARFAELDFLFAAYDVSAWSGYSRFYYWNVSDSDYNRDRYTVELHLFDTRIALPIKVEFAPHTANIIGVDAPRYLDAYSPYLDPEFLRAGRQVEAAAALQLYADGAAIKAEHLYGFQPTGDRNTFSTVFYTTHENERSEYLMTVEFRPYSPDIVHIRVETMEDAYYREEENAEAEAHGAFSD
jgi:hypothetical protein